MIGQTIEERLGNENMIRLMIKNKKNLRLIIKRF